MEIILDKTFENIDYSKTTFPKGEYDNCIFINCNFSEINLSNCIFSECEFRECNLSNAIVRATAFKEVYFYASKMLGIAFDEIDDFLISMSFEECKLSFCSFKGLSLKKQKNVKCDMEQVDFTEANLSDALFDECNLEHAIFEFTKLENVNFKTSINYTIDPEINTITGAKFSLRNVSGLLEKYKIKIT